MFKLIGFMLRSTWQFKRRWRRFLLAADLMTVMRMEFDGSFGQPHIMILDNDFYDDWIFGLSYESKSGIQVSIDILDETVEIFATGRNLSHETYFKEDIKNAGEARRYLVRYINNVARDIEEAAKLGLTDKK